MNMDPSEMQLRRQQARVEADNTDPTDNSDTSVAPAVQAASQQAITGEQLRQNRAQADRDRHDRQESARAREETLRREREEREKAEYEKRIGPAREQARVAFLANYYAVDPTATPELANAVFMEKVWPELEKNIVGDEARQREEAYQKYKAARMSRLQSER